jgi:outer membrane protein assembly factor BamA
MIGVEAHSSLPHDQNNSGNLPRQGQLSHLWPHAFGHESLIYLLAYESKEERAMNRKALTYISLSLLCSVALLALNWRPTDSEWTDKNNTEQDAAYLLKTTYYQQGYCAARVEIKQDGSKRLFIVDSGDLFHLKDVVVTGLHVFEANKLMQDGPKSGEVYSPIRMNDWAEQVRKNYAQSNGPLESIMWRVKFDYTHSQANVETSVKERN